MRKISFHRFTGLLLAGLMSLCCMPVFAETQDFAVHMLDVGEGLAVLIENDGHYMLYDGGGKDKAGDVAAYLEEHMISNLDYIITSCYDENHINGLVDVLDEVEVDKILCPDYYKDTFTYASFMSRAEESGAEIIHPVVGDSFDFKDAEIKVLNPESYDDNDMDDMSLVVKVTYDNADWLLCGDAEDVDSEKNLKADVLVTGSNGFDLDDDFLKSVDPQYTMISCAATDKFSGHDIYRTDKQGAIICKSDGGVISFNKKLLDKTVDKTEPETKPVEVEADDSGYVSISISSNGEDVLTYVCDKKSKVFHLSDCKEVQNISADDKEYTNEDRDDLIEDGYKACKICNP